MLIRETIAIITALYYNVNMWSVRPSIGVRAYCVGAGHGNYIKAYHTDRYQHLLINVTSTC